MSVDTCVATTLRVSTGEVKAVRMAVQRLEFATGTVNAPSEEYRKEGAGCSEYNCVWVRLWI